MGEPHVVSALRDKRAELAGLAKHHEEQALGFRREMVHVDAVLRLYAPELEPDSIPTRRFRQRCPFFKNREATRLCVDVLRDADEQMATNAITARVMTRKKMVSDDPKVIDQMRRTVYKTLTRQRRYFRRHDGEFGELTWSLLDPMQPTLI